MPGILLSEYSLVEEKVHPLSEVAGKAILDMDLPTESIIAAVIRRGKLLVPRGGWYCTRVMRCLR